MSTYNGDHLVMTISEVAKALRISRALAYDLARQDKLPVPVITIGNKRMIVARQAVENLLAGKQKEAEK